MITKSFTIPTGTSRISCIAAEGQEGLPLLVCIPGGSYNARYFDAPGYSLLETAHANGFPIVALDRPGYGASDPLEGETSFSRNADVLNSAIAELWKKYSDRSPGIVLVGHSMGGAIALHIAARPRTWPLLGVSISAIHTDAPGSVTQAWNSMPDGAVIEFSADQRIQFMYGPEDTFEADIVEKASAACEPIPVAELREVVAGWIQDFPVIAAQVDVPIQYALAEHEQLWVSSDANVQSFADAFTSSPMVISERVAGAGHNIDHHRTGPQFHLGQLAFARRAAERANQPSYT
jgi:pimeloyl-ACP methyl ester carboxylesterase